MGMLKVMREGCSQSNCHMGMCIGVVPFDHKLVCTEECMPVSLDGLPSCYMRLREEVILLVGLVHTNKMFLCCRAQVLHRNQTPTCEHKQAYIPTNSHTRETLTQTFDLPTSGWMPHHVISPTSIVSQDRVQRQARLLGRSHIPTL